MKKVKAFDPNIYDKEFKVLSINEIKVDNYQSSLNESRVRNIVNNYNPVGVGTLFVSARGGSFYVFDGQHRLEALKRLGIKRIECIVYKNLSYVDEAMAWDYFNASRKPVKALDKANAKVEQGDADAISLKLTVESLGLEIDYHHIGRQDSIKAIASLERVFKSTDGAHLQEVLTIIKEAYGTNNTFQGWLIEGLSDFLVFFGTNDLFDKSALKKRMYKKGFIELRQLVASNKKLHFQTPKQATVSALLQIYNHKRKNENKLRF